MYPELLEFSRQAQEAAAFLKAMANECRLDAWRVYRDHDQSPSALPQTDHIAVPANRVCGDCPDEQIMIKEPEGPSVQG